ncbi:hypothetical protein ACO22_03221 [Paracoccidioides brasiliensis]|uniref:RING-type E3 ubiquitin transferase n=1 Tax=Paracoccidioides brasiliensis TaxID=121759 RepID=A0A1D2JGK9_PARBR|nr:hypothetical protein ACO22_03221 [Paracoccidioides brasiliensis]
MSAAVGIGAPGPTAGSGKHDSSGLLRTVQGHVEDIRSLISCGVCVKPLYEPFTLACGHTFCYSCLTQWFVSHRRKKTCPDCRAIVSTQPAPAYLIREIVQMFISRAELLENNETTAEHLSNKRAETEKIEIDKHNPDPSTGGLFQGCFKCAGRFIQPINDVMDGVTRCPRCAWELEEGGCLHCGFAIEGYTDSEYITDDDASITITDAADDIEDGFSAIDDDGMDWSEFYGANAPGNHFNAHHHQHQYHQHEHDTDASSIIHGHIYRSEDEDTHDSDMSDFIDDGPVEEAGETDHSTVVDENTVISDGELDGHSTENLSSSRRSTRAAVRQTITLDDDDDDDEYEEEEDIEEDRDDVDAADAAYDEDNEDNEPIRSPTRAIQQRRQRRQTSSTSFERPSRLQSSATTVSRRAVVSDDDDDDDDDDHHSDESHLITNVSNQAQVSGSHANSPITLDDDSDVPVRPARRSRRGSRPDRVRLNQRRSRRTRSQAMIEDPWPPLRSRIIGI